MSYSIENAEGCKKKITFDFKEIDLTSQIKRALERKRSEVAIKGFRKGMAPVSMIEKLYRPEVESNAIGEFIQENYMKAVSTEQIKVAGQPAVENMKYDGGKTISFDCYVEVFPEFTLKDMSSLKFTKDTFEINDEELVKVRQGYLESKAELVPLEGDKTLENGHHSVMNFQGMLESGDKPENMKGNDFPLEIGSNQFIPGFEEQMAGMKKGENKSIEVTFPEDYHAEDLKGAKVTFEVELLDIKEKKWPELTDEMAKEFGYESIEDFETKNKERLVVTKEKESEDKLRREIIAKLLEENSFDVPITLLDRQKEHVKNGMATNLKNQGFNDEMVEGYFEKWNNDITEKALFELKSGLLLDKLANDYEISTNDDDFNLKITEMAKTMSLPEDTIKQFYGKAEAKSNLLYSIREDKTFDKIKEKIVVL